MPLSAIVTADETKLTFKGLMMLTNIEIPDREILECQSAKAALRMSADRSANNRKAIAIDLGITESHLSRALSNDYDVTLRHDLVIPFMVSCGNAIYLRWLYLHMTRLLPDLDKHQRPGDAEIVREELAAVRLTLKELVDEIKLGRSPKTCSECGARFALTTAVRRLPEWLITAALWIEFETGEL